MKAKFFSNLVSFLAWLACDGGRTGSLTYAGGGGGGATAGVAGDRSVERGLCL